jgi:hypothetical protein
VPAAFREIPCRRVPVRVSGYAHERQVTTVPQQSLGRGPANTRARRPAHSEDRLWVLRAAAVIVVAVAAGLRLWRLDLIIYEVDEAAILRLAEDMLRLGRIPLSGPIFSAGIPSAPNFIYLLAPVVAISRDPAFVAGAIAAANVLGLVGTVWLGWRAFGPLAGLSAGALYAVNPWAIFYARRIWQPELLPPLAVLLFIALDLAVANRRVWWAAATFPLLALAAGVHPSAATLAPLLLAPAVVLLHARRWRPLVVGCALAGLTGVPYALHEIQTRWVDVANIRYYASLHTWFDLDSVRYAVGLATGLAAQNDPAVPQFGRAFPNGFVQVAAALEMALLLAAIVFALVAIVPRRRARIIGSRERIITSPKRTVRGPERTATSPEPGATAPNGTLSPSRPNSAAHVRPAPIPEPGGTQPRGTPPGDAPPRGTPPGDAPPRDASPGDAPPRDASPGDAPPRDASPGDTQPDDASPGCHRARLAGLLLWLALPIALTVRHTLPLQSHYYLVLYPAPFLLIGAGLSCLVQRANPSRIVAASERLARLAPLARGAAVGALAVTLAIQTTAVVSVMRFMGAGNDACFGPLLPTAESAEREIVDLGGPSATTHAAVELQAADSLPLAYLLRSDFPIVDLAGSGDIGLGARKPVATAGVKPEAQPRFLTAPAAQTRVLTSVQARDLRYASGVQLLRVGYSDQPRGDQRVVVGLTWRVEPEAVSNHAFVWDLALVDAAGQLAVRHAGVDHILAELQGQQIVSWLTLDPSLTDAGVLAPGAYTARLQLRDTWIPEVVPFTDTADSPAGATSVAQGLPMPADESLELGPISIPPPTRACSAA